MRNSFSLGDHELIGEDEYRLTLLLEALEKKGEVRVVPQTKPT